MTPQGILHPFEVYPLGCFKKSTTSAISNSALSHPVMSSKDALDSNINICHNVITFFRSCGNVSVYGSHTGGAFDTVPEAVLFDDFSVRVLINLFQCFTTNSDIA